MQTIVLSGTCSAGGDLTMTGDTNHTGFVEKIVMDYIDGDTNADVVITAENNGISEAIITKANMGISDVVYYPRTLGNKVADGAAFTDVAERIFVNASSFKAVVAQGGNAKLFKFIIVLSNEPK